MSGAGKIYYHVALNSLYIIGGGVAVGNREVKIYDNLVTNGTIHPGGLLTLANDGLSVGGTTYTSTQVKTALDAANAALPVSGGTCSGTITMSHGFNATDGATQCNASVASFAQVYFNFTDLGSPPTGLYAFKAVNTARTYMASAGLFFSNGNVLVSLSVIGENSLPTTTYTNNGYKLICISNNDIVTSTIKLSFNRLV